MPEPANEPSGPRLMSDFSLIYVPDEEQAVILGLHVPTPEQQEAFGFQPHWEPLIFFDWDQARAMLKDFVGIHEAFSPVVERKRELQAGDLMPQEAWRAACAEMRPDLPPA